VTEADFLRALSLADRLRIAAVDLAITGARRALVEAIWVASAIQGDSNYADILFTPSWNREKWIDSFMSKM
jgi:hypothetical protein